MILTTQDALTMRSVAKDVYDRLYGPSEGQAFDKDEWKALIAKLLKALGPQILALLIALLTEPKQT
jgi:hypothetical protein